MKAWCVGLGIIKMRDYLKDNKKRYQYKKIELETKLAKILSLYSSGAVSRISKRSFALYCKSDFKSCIKNYCIITGRSRGVYKKMRVSRIFFRVLGSEGLFFGLKKAGW
jgi:ribosomal protein S14